MFACFVCFISTQKPVTSEGNKGVIDDDSKEIFCTYVCLAEASGDHFIVIGLEMSYDILMEFTAGPKN